MTTQNKKTKSERSSNSDDSKWGRMLAGLIFVITCLLILGFLWQSIASFLSPE
jgi:flagellar biogenesis protein FliO